MLFVQATFDNPSLIKSAVVRNPASRLLSGYLDKMIRQKRYGFVRGMGQFVREKGSPPTFEEFVNVLMTNHPNPNIADQHFRLQSSFCGIRSGVYDFYGDLENMGEDFVEFARSVGIWDDYGADGWGENHDEPFIDDRSGYQYTLHNSYELIWQYYTEDLLKRVYEYYKEDFDRFGFSIEPILAAKPSDLSVSSS